MLTGCVEVKVAVAMLKNGAMDYIRKPVLPDELLATVNKALSSENGPAIQPAVQPTTHSQNSVVKGASPNMIELFEQVDLIAPTGYSVIIYGESGTGKEVVARAIHGQSNRAHQPFIALDCGTLSKELARSELFGHMKGSFTGAIEEKPGHFEMAEGGTLFLDEVGNLSIDIQASLLRVLQERKFKRVGGTHEISVDVRILVASNENLKECCADGTFREDLYHRLNELSIVVPPLRERKIDIPLLAEFFLEKANRELGKAIQGFEPVVLELMAEYPWPGNVRELMNVMRRMALLAGKNEKVISKKLLPLEIAIPPFSAGNQINSMDSSKLKTASLDAVYNRILTVLREVNNNKTKAADILHIDRKTIYNKIREYRQHNTEQLS